MYNNSCYTTFSIATLGMCIACEFHQLAAVRPCIYHIFSAPHKMTYAYTLGTLHGKLFSAELAMHVRYQTHTNDCIFVIAFSHPSFWGHSPKSFLCFTICKACKKHNTNSHASSFLFIVANLAISLTWASKLPCISNTDQVEFYTLKTSDIYHEQLTLLSMLWFICCYVMQIDVGYTYVCRSARSTLR